MKYKIRIFTVFLVSFLFVSLKVYSQNFWQQTNGPFGGNSYQLTQAPNGDLYVAAGYGGIYKSINGGNSWVRLNTLAPAYDMYQCYYIFAASNGYIYAAGGRKLHGPTAPDPQFIYRSSDNGNTWQSVTGTYLNRVVGFAESTNGTIFAARQWEAGSQGGIYRTMNGGLNWDYTPSPGPIDGALSVTADNNGFIYAGLGQGAGWYMRSTNNGNSWVTDGSIDAGQFLVRKSNRNVFAGRNGIFRSTNFGSNWTNVSSAFFSGAGKMWLDASENIYTAVGGQVYRSTDNGTTWVNLSISLPPGFNDLFPLQNPIFYACVNNDFVYKSTNQGQNWFKQENGVVGSEVTGLAASQNGFLFAIRSGVGIYRSSDNGDSWSLINTSFQSGSMWADSSSNIFIVSGGSLQRSTDNGSTWTSSGSGISGSVTFFSAGYDRNLYAVASGIYKSTNNGAGWFSIGQPGSVNSLAVNSQGHVYARNSNAIYKTTNSGGSWQTLTPGYSSLNSISINSVNGDVYITDFNSSFYKSTNGGSSWINIVDTNTARPLAVLVNPNGSLVSISLRQNYGSYYCKSSNFGSNWVSVQSGWVYWDAYPIVAFIGPNGYLYESAYSFYSGTQAYIGVWRSFTSSNTFSISGQIRYQDNNQPVNSGYVKALKYFNGQVITLDSAVIQSNGNYILNNVPQDSTDLMAFQDDEDNLQYVPTYYQSTIYWQQSNTLYPTGNLNNINIGVYRINNASQSTGKITGTVFGGSADYYGIRDARIYAKTGGVYKGYSITISNGTYTIDSLPNGSYEVTCDMIGYNGQMQTVNHNGGIVPNINFYLTDWILPVIEPGTTLPKEFSLFQNYPNPFNPVTNIKFDIPKRMFVKLKIFDMLGREIAVLSNQQLEPGRYNVTWDASVYSSGVYFYRIEAGDFIQSRKLVLIK